jgi:hypothetical protein
VFFPRQGQQEFQFVDHETLCVINVLSAIPRRPSAKVIPAGFYH